MALRRALLAVLWLLGLGSVQAETLPPRPSGYILDEPDILAPADETALRRKLQDYERRTSNEVVLAIFSALPPKQILEDYTARVGREWGLGTKERDNGVILFVFLQDKLSRLEVGYGLEGALPDSVADRILRDSLQPSFAAGNYGLGVDSAMRAILHVAEAEYTAAASPSYASDTMVWVIVALFFLFAIWVHIGDTVFQRAGRFVLWQVFDVLRIILMMVVSGGRGGDSDGGGGDFGGGGASGRW
jgi:uncharacterized protein